MTKRYLNKAERSEALILGGISETLDKFAVTARELGRKEQAKRLKTAATHVQRVLEMMVQPLSDEQADIVMRDAARSNIIAVRGSEADLLERKRKFQDVPTDYVYGLARAVVETACQDCKLRGKAAAECEARQAMLKIGVPVYDEHAPEGVCPYRVVV